MWVDVGEDSSVGDGGVGHESVQLLIVSDGKKNVSGVDSVLLVVLGGVSGEFENLQLKISFYLSSKVLENGTQVNGSSGSNSLGISALLQVS